MSCLYETFQFEANRAKLKTHCGVYFRNSFKKSNKICATSILSSRREKTLMVCDGKCHSTSGSFADVQLSSFSLYIAMFGFGTLTVTVQWLVQQYSEVEQKKVLT